MKEEEEMKLSSVKVEKNECKYTRNMFTRLFRLYFSAIYNNGRIVRRSDNEICSYEEERGKGRSEGVDRKIKE